MLYPVTKRAILEGLGAGTSVIVALSITTQEVGILLAVATAAIGVVVWLVRLEGRIDTLVQVNAVQHEVNGVRHDENSRRLDRIADAIGTPRK